MSSFSSLPGLKYGTFFGGTSTLSPVLGLRPFRGSRRRKRKLPNPRSSIFSPRCNASMMLLNTVSTMTSECFLVRSETRDTSSTSSAFVMLPVVFIGVLSLTASGSQRSASSLAAFIAGSWKLGAGSRSLLLMLEVIPERHFRPSGRLGVRLPVRPELVVLQRPDAQPDLPLRRNQLDDLHLVALAHLELQLLVLARMLRVVELRHVDQPLDALGQLHERPEVGEAHDLALDHVTHVMLGEELVPHVGLELLEPERQALVLGVDVEHHRLDRVPLLQHL